MATDRIYKKNINYIGISLMLMLLDQLSKYWARMNLEWAQGKEVLAFFDLFLQYNQGAAFSILSGGLWWQRLFLLTVSVVLSAVLSLWIVTTPSQQGLKITSLVLILAGALGNMIDRIIFAEVTDFISLHGFGYYFPTFNIADSMITIGVILLFVHLLYDED